MNKTKKYINYIVDDLISKTEINYDTRYINNPLLSISSRFPVLWEPSQYHIDSILKVFKEKYGIVDEDFAIVVWKKYAKIMSREIKYNQPPIFESVNKREKYMNYVVEDLVKKTTIYAHPELIFYPDHPDDELTLDDIDVHATPYYMSEYLKNRYGAGESEIDDICYLYREGLKLKIDVLLSTDG